MKDRVYRNLFQGIFYSDFLMFGDNDVIGDTLSNVEITWFTKDNIYSFLKKASNDRKIHNYSFPRMRLLLTFFHLQNQMGRDFFEEDRFYRLIYQNTVDFFNEFGEKNEQTQDYVKLIEYLLNDYLKPYKMKEPQGLEELRIISLGLTRALMRKEEQKPLPKNLWTLGYHYLFLKSKGFDLRLRNDILDPKDKDKLLEILNNTDAVKIDDFLNGCGEEDSELE